jgi:hypothetical protein
MFPAVAAQPLCAALLAKIDEQMERTAHLSGLVPAGCLDAAPVAGQSTVGALLGHLLECMAGFCAVLAAAHPELQRDFASLRSLPVNHSCAPGEALERISVYRRSVESGFTALTDAGLARLIPTIFVAEGEPLLTLLLGNLEHLMNHKHQLFIYLKLMGIEAASPDLYRFRGTAGSFARSRNV